MSAYSTDSPRARPQEHRGAGELSETERWASLLGGAALTVAALRRGSVLARLALGAAGLASLTRAGTGYCAVKAALDGEAALGDGVREQWRRVRERIAPAAAAPTVSIDSLDTLYAGELQDLVSAESQLGSLLDAIVAGVGSVPLRHALDGYATEIRSRRDDLARLLGGAGAEPSPQGDAGMRALIEETHRFMRISGRSVRDAALAASVQRLLHYKIAGYGTVAAYAKSLGREEHASRLAEYADRDKSLDAELSELGIRSLNPQASAEGRVRDATGSARPDVRTH